MRSKNSPAQFPSECPAAMNERECIICYQIHVLALVKYSHDSAHKQTAITFSSRDGSRSIVALERSYRKIGCCLIENTSFSKVQKLPAAFG
jgi:hypothetical protein